MNAIVVLYIYIHTYTYIPSTYACSVVGIGYIIVSMLVFALSSEGISNDILHIIFNIP